MTLPVPPLPTPRAPVVQGIDINNALVIDHANKYQLLLANISQNITQQNATIIANPFNTAPLCLYLGFYWPAAAETATITVGDKAGANIPLTFTQPLTPGANLVPVAGLIPGVMNVITLETSFATTQYEYTTGALPPTDADSPTGFQKFPVISLDKPVADPASLAPGLYFTTHFNRYNLAIDYQAVVRWYTTQEIPSYNMLRLPDGHFISGAQNFDAYKTLYEFDIMGRVWTVYKLDNELHHSLSLRPNGQLVAGSEYSGLRPDGTHSVEDGVTFIDLATGYETAYYDMNYVMDRNRPTRPSAADATLNDWLHINQCYVNETNQLLVCSSRHQSAVFGVDLATSQLVFIMGNHENWSADYAEYLLTPCDENNIPLTWSADEMNEKYWNWGQHNAIEVANSNTGFLDISLFNNGNYRSNDDAKSVESINNQSRIDHFRIDLTAKTVSKLSEIPGDNKGYSSLCGAKEIQANGNIVVHYGGATFDEKGQAITCDPGFSDIIYEGWGETAEGILPLQELSGSGEILLAVTFRSGRPKSLAVDGAGFRYDMTAFRVYKMPLFY
ncbi:aryl-sulfate sulfotransferase [Atlantibacter hermannii]|uniref:aryl-sulfate sulfotransferase n=1 Tax=Atlantibacter hermannii TaxID=565 RepID=UPI0025411EC7|nr:aryl-sulfate sulfotransferase [Atlantibacter hermannii]WIF58066.1 aryl-sulfate sulfotransferase [Atlantibacter hermannii]